MAPDVAGEKSQIATGRPAAHLDSLFQRCAQKIAVASVSGPPARALSDRDGRGAAVELDRAGQHGPAGRCLQRQRAAMTTRGRQARRERVELIVQAPTQRV